MTFSPERVTTQTTVARQTFDAQRKWFRELASKDGSPVGFTSETEFAGNAYLLPDGVGFYILGIVAGHRVQAFPSGEIAKPIRGQALVILDQEGQVHALPKPPNLEVGSAVNVHDAYLLLPDEVKSKITNALIRSRKQRRSKLQPPKR